MQKFGFARPGLIVVATSALAGVGCLWWRIKVAIDRMVSFCLLTDRERHQNRLDLFLAGLKQWVCCIGMPEIKHDDPQPCPCDSYCSRVL